MSCRPFVSHDPARRSGTPTINGSRLSIDVLCHSVWAGYPVAQVAHEFGCTREDVLTACWFAGTYGLADQSQAEAARWRKRWGAWARQAHDHMWSGEYGEVLDPPTEEQP